MAGKPCVSVDDALSLEDFRQLMPGTIRPQDLTTLLMRIRAREVAETGSFSGWGKVGRLQRLAYLMHLKPRDLAELLVDGVIEHYRHEMDRDAVIFDFISEMAGPGGVAAHRPEPEPPRKRSFKRIRTELIEPAVIEELIQKAARDALAWDACERLFTDAVVLNTSMPASLAAWKLRAVQGKSKRPTPGSGPSPGSLRARDKAIRFAVRLALESGAFEAASHSSSGQSPARNEAPGACEFVSSRFIAAGINASYPLIDKVWRERRKS